MLLVVLVLLHSKDTPLLRTLLLKTMQAALVAEQKQPHTNDCSCETICIFRYAVATLSLHRFRDINTYLPKVKTLRDLDHAHLGGRKFVITGLLRAGGKTPIPGSVKLNTGPHIVVFGREGAPAL